MDELNQKRADKRRDLNHYGWHDDTALGELMRSRGIEGRWVRWKTTTNTARVRAAVWVELGGAGGAHDDMKSTLKVLGRRCLKVETYDDMVSLFFESADAFDPMIIDLQRGAFLRVDVCYGLPDEQVVCSHEACQGASLERIERGVDDTVTLVFDNGATLKVTNEKTGEAQTPPVFVAERID